MNDKGSKMMEEAEKGLTKFSLFTAKEEKYEKAHDRFVQAATFFKAESNWPRAAAAYERAADMSDKLQCEIDFIQDIQNAAMMLRKSNDQRAVTLLARVVELYDKQGKYRDAAKFCVTQAEDPSVSADDSIELLQRAAKYYKSDNSKASAAEINEKIGNALIKGGKYNEARKLFEKIATECLDERLTRGMARKHFFMSLLSELADIQPASIDTGIDNLRERFEKFQDLDSQFNEHTREHMLIKGILDSLEAQDMEAYEEAVNEYDTICPLDDKKTKMLLRGKHLLRQEDLR